MLKLNAIIALAAAVLALAPVAAAQGNPDTDYDGTPDAVLSMNGGGARYTWTMLAANATPRSRPGGDWVGTKFYLIGGESTGGTRADRVEIFNGATLTWSTSASVMPIPVSNIMGSTAAVGSKIYVFGGYDVSGGYRAEVQIYDTATDTWSMGGTFPTGGRYGCLAETISSNTIFVCGGNISGTATNQSFRYNTTTNTFAADAAMPTSRQHVTGAYNPAQNRVYAVGGFATGTAFEYYNTSTGTWTVGPPVPTDRAGGGVVTLGNYVLAYGGNWSLYLNTSDLYNASTNSWGPAPIPNMNVGRRTFAYGLYNAGGTQAAMASDGWRGLYMVDNEALH